MLYSRRKWRNRLWLWLAYRMPGSLAYFCVVRIWDHAIDNAMKTKDPDLFSMTVVKMMVSWDERPISTAKAFGLAKERKHPLRDGVWKL